MLVSFISFIYYHLEERGQYPAPGGFYTATDSDDNSPTRKAYLSIQPNLVKNYLLEIDIGKRNPSKDIRYFLPDSV